MGSLLCTCHLSVNYYVQNQYRRNETFPTKASLSIEWHCHNSEVSTTLFRRVLLIQGLLKYCPKQVLASIPVEMIAVYQGSGQLKTIQVDIFFPNFNYLGRVAVLIGLKPI